MRSKSIVSLLAVGALGLSASVAQAAPKLRVQVDQHGDFAVIGNTLGYDCSGEVPPSGLLLPLLCGGLFDNDSSPDYFWRADEPSVGKAKADGTITPSKARSTAVLNLPTGAKVTHAYLYWAATVDSAIAGATATLDRQGGFSTTVMALESYKAKTQGQNAYQSVADVTDIVKEQGSGGYRVGNFAAKNVTYTTDEVLFAGWWMTVFYELPSDPPRNLALFDGFDSVATNSTQTATLEGFRVPNSGFDGKLAAVAFEGDHAIKGDSLEFNGTKLTNGVNPVDNFFNGSRSWLGAPFSVAGDLPNLSGKANSMAGVDIDVVDVTSLLTAGATSATIKASTSNDVFLLGGFVTSISTFKPDFSAASKTVAAKVEGPIRPGSVLTYTIVAPNDGDDTSIGTSITDALPVGVTFVPGSIRVTAGANVGAKTDAAGDDQGEYDAASRTVTVRIGAGASATSGGKLAPGESSTVTFEVTVDATASGTIHNQATITASGQLGDPETETPTDGNGPEPGSPATPVDVDECATNADCPATSPLCDTSGHPYVCSGCVDDSACSGTTPTCDVPTSTCTCEPTNGGVELCDGNDNDCDGEVDESCTCTTDAECGDADSGKVCDDATKTCVEGCRGEGGNGCPSGGECSSTDGSVGTCPECVTDADCGDVTSGKVCDEATGTCVDGCRKEGGNGCAEGAVCSSSDDEIGTCGCISDADCGGENSGRVCDDETKTCTDGCRTEGGNACPEGEVCSSADSATGTCGPDGGAGGGSGAGGHGGSSSNGAGVGGGDVAHPKGVTASGNGLLCAAPAGGSSDEGAGWLIGGVAAALVAARRRRRGA